MYMDNDYIMHYGILRRSGRYPWGSGGNAYQRSEDFIGRVNKLKQDGVSETDIAAFFGLTTKQLRTQIGVANYEQRAIKVATAKDLQAKGMGPSEIAQKMGLKNESSARSLLDTGIEERSSLAMKTADFLMDQVDKKGIIDVGKGVNLELNISPERFDQALYIMQMNGYEVYSGRHEQVTNKGKWTTIKAACPPGTAHKEIFVPENVHSVTEYISRDGGTNFSSYKYPASMSSDRIKIRYAEDGGANKDGTIEIRRNVPDLSLGTSRYSQVRMLVDNDRYLKGMALYSDDIPNGYDVVFNTNKSKNVSKRDVMKAITDDPDNPFGSLIKAGGQSTYIDKNGKEQLSIINKRADEGDWSKWKDKTPSQFLAKQNQKLIDSQLDATFKDRKAELDEILAISNDPVRRKLLMDFADDADASAVHLKTAALPGQKYQVLLPLNNIRDTEVYAPNFQQGEKIALVRFPHGGTFEIPIVTVNNRNVEGKKTIPPDALDAIGINKNVADRLSGADFDGDAVIAIPITSKTKITSKSALTELEGFDAKYEYPEVKGMTYMKNPTTGKDKTEIEMGKISNLITDMTIQGATDAELARAVKHSMCVIDASKHKLNYKQSEIDNDIKSLKKAYQGVYDETTGKTRGGASTLLSRANAEISVPRYRGQPNIDPKTGRVSYTEAFTPSQRVKDPATYTTKDGVTVQTTRKSKQLAETEDAFTLSTGTPVENAYAAYSNSLKDLANLARRESLAIPNVRVDLDAKARYSNEIQSLNAKLVTAQKNAPKERQAQLLATSAVNAKKQAVDEMSKSEEKKLRQQELTRARDAVGAKREPISITPLEWEAIDNNALTDTKITSILGLADMDKVREYTTPRANTVMTDAKMAKLRAMNASGRTISEMAEALGVSPATVRDQLGK